ncbi:MAG: GNAT family N-acetyltransferase [Acidobacteriia bacterium]|nr:GNAT family N-acetyltransferase [Terriglobia bacterium]
MSSKPSEAFVVRAGTPADVETIMAHRRAMFFDMGYRDAGWLDEMSAAFLPWLRRKMESGEYLAWFAMTPEGSVAAGAGLWLMDWPGGLHGCGALRGNVLNVYTEAAYRRQGLARRLMAVILDWCRSHDVPTVVLHASDEGRPLYVSLGFQATNEMRIDLGK